MIPLFVPIASFPLRTLTGLKPDKKNAGYVPASNPIIIVAEKHINQKLIDSNGMRSALFDKSLNKGKAKKANPNAMIKESVVSNIDSVRNCLIK